MKKTLGIIMSVLMVMCLFTGCGSDDSETIKIGIMQFGEFDALQNAHKGFVDGLAEAGYKDGENITINYLSAAADTANCPTIADTLINDGSDLILAIATPSVSALKEKTTTIPVLFTAVTDPVASGIIADNKVPGGNISGSSDLNPVKEQIDLIKQIIPDAKTVAVMYCSSESNSAAQYELAKAEITALGMTCVQKTIADVSEIKSAVESLAGKVDAVYIPTDNTLADAMTTVAAAANESKLPVITGEPGMVKNGGLATFGIDYYSLGKQTAQMAVEILTAEDPLAAVANMPVVYQTDAEDCETAVNTDTAAAIGITIPQEVLDIAVTYPAE
ncbi:MAG: ABC transporter substrate-binding protein [Anaerofustis stercorihominis]|nr:ABC transporter substrate-binding protein [Anaerofustis stercorihominis]